MQERSSAYVFAGCRHPALLRQRNSDRRNYSDTSSPPKNGGNFARAWGNDNGVNVAGSSVTPPRPMGPVRSSGWGKPAFGGGVSSGTASGSTPSNLDSRKVNSSQSHASAGDGLLPHERAARKRLQKPVPSEPPLTSRTTSQRGLGLGQRSSRESPRGPMDNASIKPRNALGGLEEKTLRTNRSKEQPEKRWGNYANGAAKKDWRHRESDRTPLPGSDRKLPSTPVPHHRHAVREELGRPPVQKGLRRHESGGLGQSNTGDADAWGLLTRKATSSSFSSPVDVSSDGTPMTKESFFNKFQERMGEKRNGNHKSSQPARAEPSAVVEEVIEVSEQAEEKIERRTREFDESYEIDRDSKRRDKAGSRRGDVSSSSRGMKKSASQKRWEDENEEWDARGARRAAERRQQKAKDKAQRKALASAAATQTIFLPEFISISNLGMALKMKPQAFLTSLAEMGFEDITEDSIMTGETASLVAMEFGFEPTVDSGGVRDLRPRPPPDDVSSVPSRPPVVTIMGHVDHGKTTLLDYLRKSSVAAQEHGGITQHIGAFMVKMSSGKLITFLDTPGHAAFLTMRQRGANVTDIVVLVVAADDSVKPQTLEALKHARAAKVPIIVAINKVDKEDARPDQVKADLARHGVEIEDFGGDVQVVCVSGKTGQGMDELEENIGALAEIQDVRAEDDGMAEAWVLEASVKPYGKSANILVKRGTLRPGDHIVAGTTWARIRILRNEAGQELTEAPPGTPVEVLGWREELPAAGDEILQAPDEDRARTAVDYREEMREREISSKQLAEQEQREREAKAAVETNEDEGEEGPSMKTVNFTVRGDVVGSVEAVCTTINEIGNNEVKSRILWSSAGQVSETDVEHAAASNSVIVNFNSTVPGHIKSLAEEKGVRLIDHTVIYHLADEVKQVMSESLAPKISQKVMGEAEILQIFPINIKGRSYKNIAGCRVRNGLVSRSTNVRVIRKGEKVFDGKIETLKHGKKDVAEIRKGSECGISFDGFTDFMVGDQIQTYEEVREKRNL
nr:translation initiation factor IF-2 [Colletotrichum truncatum]KAF6787237.1 translation initiation factor IF-2 [Colletotrichum truncatum]